MSRNASPGRTLLLLLPVFVLAAWIVVGWLSAVISEYNYEYLMAQQRRTDGREYATYEHCANNGLRYRYERHNMMDCNTAERFASIDPALEAQRAVWEKSFVNRFVVSLAENVEHSMQYISVILFVIMVCVIMTIFQWLSAFVRTYWTRSMDNLYDYVAGDLERCKGHKSL